MNCYSGRISIFPSRNWLAQFSMGRLTDPERPVAGAHGPWRHRANDRFRPLHAYFAGGKRVVHQPIWGQNHGIASKRNTNAYLLETLYPVTRKDFLTGQSGK